MHVNNYHVILSPEQASILHELPAHLQLVGEAATGKTELLKAVAHIICKCNSGRSDCPQSNVSSIAKGVDKIVYIIFGDKPYLKEHIQGYFSLLGKNLQLTEGDKMAFEVHSITGNSFEDICNNLLKFFESIKKRKNLFALIDECYHWLNNVHLSEQLFSFKGCWIATVLTGQPPYQVLQREVISRIFPKRTLRRVYRGTKRITLASSNFRLSNPVNFIYMANKFSYIESHGDMEIKDIVHAADLCRKKVHDSLFILFKGKDGSEQINDFFVTVSRNNDYRRNQFEEIDLQKEKIDDRVIYAAGYSGAEWKSVFIILNISVKEFQLNDHVLYLLLSLSTSRALCGCLILCRNRIKKTLHKIIYPSSVTADLRTGKCQDWRIFQDKNFERDLISIFSNDPIFVAAGAYNIDLIKSFVENANERLLSSETYPIIFFCLLTEPSPDQRMVDLTMTILKKSIHQDFEKFIYINSICLYQSMNKWHLDIVKSILDHFRPSANKLVDFLSETVITGHITLICLLWHIRAAHIVLIYLLWYIRRIRQQTVQSNALTFAYGSSACGCSDDLRAVRFHHFASMPETT